MITLSIVYAVIAYSFGRQMTQCHLRLTQRASRGTTRKLSVSTPKSFIWRDVLLVQSDEEDEEVAHFIAFVLTLYKHRLMRQT